MFAAIINTTGPRKVIGFCQKDSSPYGVTALYYYNSARGKFKQQELLEDPENFISIPEHAKDIFTIDSELLTLAEQLGVPANMGQYQHVDLPNLRTSLHFQFVKHGEGDVVENHSDTLGKHVLARWTELNMTRSARVSLEEFSYMKSLWSYMRYGMLTADTEDFSFLFDYWNLSFGILTTPHEYKEILAPTIEGAEARGLTTALFPKPRRG